MPLNVTCSEDAYEQRGHACQRSCCRPAVELRQCTALREVSLESNRLTTPVMDLRALSRLQSLQLFGNPLDFLPELSPCTDLRHLSLANVRISADAYFSRWVGFGLISGLHSTSMLLKLWTCC